MFLVNIFACFSHFNFIFSPNYFPFQIFNLNLVIKPPPLPAAQSMDQNYFLRYFVLVLDD
jgi:hypothetical protein